MLMVGSTPCPHCIDGQLVPVSDTNGDGVSLTFKVWLCVRCGVHLSLCNKVPMWRNKEGRPIDFPSVNRSL